MNDLYIACFGAIFLKLSDKTANELKRLWYEGLEKKMDYYEPYYKTVFELQKQFLNNLKHNNNISNIELFFELHEDHQKPFIDYLNPENEYLMQFSTPFKFDVTLAFNERAYPSYARYAKSVITRFSVIYDGKVFLAYAPIQKSLNESIMFGPEVREFLIKSFMSENWTPHILPPCPLRFNFFIVSDTIDKDLKTDIELFNEFIFPIPYSDETAFNELINVLFCDNNFAIECFCTIMSILKRIEGIIKNIEILYADIKSLFFKLKINKIIRKDKNDLNNKIFSLYSLLYEYDKFVFLYNDKVDSFSNLFNSKEICDILYNYCLTEFKKINYPQFNIIKTIEYIQNKISATTSNFYVIVSGLMGTILGFVLNFFFK